MAVGTLLETYLSRFGVPTDGLSVETIAFAAAPRCRRPCRAGGG